MIINNEHFTIIISKINLTQFIITAEPGRRREFVNRSVLEETYDERGTGSNFSLDYYNVTVCRINKIDVRDKLKYYLSWTISNGPQVFH